MTARREVSYTPAEAGAVKVCFSEDGASFVEVARTSGGLKTGFTIAAGGTYMPTHSPMAGDPFSIITSDVGVGQRLLSLTRCETGIQMARCKGTTETQSVECQTDGLQDDGVPFNVLMPNPAEKVYLCVVKAGASAVTVPLGDGSGETFSVPDSRAKIVYDVEAAGSGAVEGMPFNITVDMTCLPGQPLVAVTDNKEGCGALDTTVSSGGSPRSESREGTAEFTIDPAGPVSMSGGQVPHYVCVSTDGGNTFRRINRAEGSPEFTIEVPSNNGSAAGLLTQTVTTKTEGGFDLWWLFLLLSILLCCSVGFMYYKWRQAKGELEDLKNNMHFQDYELDERLLDPDFVGGQQDEDVPNPTAGGTKANPMAEVDMDDLI
eukprot:TRINITY_DN66022_c0_g1_i1.p1 TRINITY_DN66022_c0_g1~~TRINITY_DN66022_c0_g1_i1.p1  ORF type:complete len:386 (+),score=143.79 TRINITY_DN66022_c0_g1_i1:33-1160(+)